jgi:hypothetical protein
MKTRRFAALFEEELEKVRQHQLAHNETLRYLKCRDLSVDEIEAFGKKKSVHAAVEVRPGTVGFDRVEELKSKPHRSPILFFCAATPADL